MPVITCPKCGKTQPADNTECAQCGVIFRKLSTSKPDPPKDPPPVPPVHEAPAAIVDDKEFIPPVGLSRNLEISILNIFAYIYLILGVGAGIGIILQGRSEFSFLLGIMIISADLVTSMLFFVFCTIAKKIISIDNSLTYIVRESQNQRSN